MRRSQMPEGFDAFPTFPEQDDRQIYSVTELTHLIKGKLENEIGRVLVEGEISGYRPAQSGHAYFTLKDDFSQIKAVMWRSRRERLKFDVEHGLKVIAGGQLSVYVPRGEYQIMVETLEPRGLGALQLAFEQLKEKLRAEGLFDEDHKKALPYLPDTVGVVTSPTGAAVRDIINVIRRRFPGVGIFIRPVRVQGEEAAGEIARAIEDLNRDGRVEVIIVGRGGGSLEDLWAFNEESVARAIAASRIPTLSAVGHETDVTIADFVADVRAATPSAAAERVVQPREELQARVNAAGNRLGAALRLRLARTRARFWRGGLCLRGQTA
jgi:exodeoxyribonuclease VII large subunit